MENITAETPTTAANLKAIVANLLDADKGYHLLLRIAAPSVSSSGSLGKSNSEWFVIDEETSLAKGGLAEVYANESATAADYMNSIYVFRATADASKNAGINLAGLINDTKSDAYPDGFTEIWRIIAYSGGTTPARQVSINIKKDGAAVADVNKGSVTGTYTMDGKSETFASGDYVPSRAMLDIRYSGAPEYYSFVNWTTSAEDSAKMTSFSTTESANPKEGFNVDASTFPSDKSLSIDCNIAPEEYHIYYVDDDDPVDNHYSFGNTPSSALYNSEVSFTINPANGYTVTAGNIAFKDVSNTTIAGLAASTPKSRTYKFTMPAKDVYISATATTASIDDYRTWGIGDSRWSELYLRNRTSTDKQGKIGTNTTEGGTLFMAFTKLLIQAGKVSYDPNAQSTNTTTVTDLASSVSGGTSNGYYAYTNQGEINDPYYWGVMGNKMGIISSFSTDNTNWDYSVSGGATARGSSDRTQAYVYRRMFGGTGNYSVTTYAPLIRDYLRGDHSEAGTSGSFNTYHYNFYDYKFHVMLKVDNYGWVAVDEARTLNDTTGNGIWVWASRRSSEKGTSSDNIIHLTSGNFTEIAAFKFATGSIYCGTSKNHFEAKQGDSDTANATLNASYSYLGATYGPFTTDFYVPHGAVVTVSRTALTAHYQPVVNKTYGAWEPVSSSIAAADYSSHSDTSFMYITSAQAAATSRKEYKVGYYITDVPRIHFKLVAGEHGSILGTLGESAVSADTATDGYIGDTVYLTVTPAANYEIDTLVIKKTDSSYNALEPAVEEGLDPDESSVTFDSERTGGEESYFIIQATFKGCRLRITYNFKEYDISKSGSYEYKSGSSYLTGKTYVKELDEYDLSVANPIQAAVIANAPALHNVYFDYNINVGSLATDTSNTLHTATVTMTEMPKSYSISINGNTIEGSFHYQENIELDASDYGVSAGEVIWTRVADTGKDGSAVVCYNPVFSFRVTSNLNLTVAVNDGTKYSPDGTSAITPGYTEVKRVNNLEKNVQNFYIQDFFFNDNPAVYDSSGNEIEGAEDITLIGAGALFYVHDTDADAPARGAFGGTIPTRDYFKSALAGADLSGMATGQGTSFNGSGLNYSYIKASTDNGKLLRYSSASNSYNYFLAISTTNDRTPENQKYSYRVYSFYVCSYTLNGSTHITTVLSDNYAQAKLFSV